MDVNVVERARPVEVALGRVQVHAAVGTPRADGDQTANDRWRDPVGPDDIHPRHPRVQPGVHVERDLRGALLAIHLEAAEHLGERVAAVLQRREDRVGGRAQPQPIERIAHGERQIGQQAALRENPLDARDREPRDRDGRPFVDQEPYPDAGAVAPDHRIDARVEKAAL
jgi:hypothetical protein